MNSLLMNIAHNWVCWAILVLAWACYHGLAVRFFQLREGQVQGGNNHLLIYIGALPLLGLFGTITGLLQCFGTMATGGTGEAITGGIGCALLTTQLGLICAIPAWLIHAYISDFERQVKLRAEVGNVRAA